MNKPFYSGPKIEIRKDFIKIKKRNITLNYDDIRRISIKHTRLDRAWFLYILAGVITFLIILFLFCIVIRDLFGDSNTLVRNGLFYRKRMMILLMLFFIGAPLFIIVKVKKYFRKYLMLVINWKHNDFRIRISDLGITAYELKNFFENKVKSMVFDI